jgi:hypothetical protein
MKLKRFATYTKIARVRRSCIEIPITIGDELDYRVTDYSKIPETLPSLSRA